ncbi:MAG TPA: amidohydrolase family protein [Candidatus Sulfotelmatobacter sp.]|nr:amidohydrolase family protein [Candidatus Sulfotelmatobacter sp.]
MRPLLFRLLLALFSFTSIIAAQTLSSVTLQASTAPIYIIHVTVIDTVVGRELPDRIVVISGDHISEVKAAKSANPPLDAQIIEGKGKYLIPGLWDMHVHALFPERLDSMFPMFIANGVLGIRDMGTSMPLTEIGQLRKDTRSGARLGPIIVAAGPILDGRPKPLRPNFLAITAPEAGRSEVDTLKSSGADLVKVYSWLSKDTFLAIADEAKKQKIPFAGHVPFSVSALEASDAGMNSMEHMFGIYLSCSKREDELRAEMLKAGPNLDGLDRIRLEVFEATDSYDDAKAARVFAHLAKNRTWQVPTFAAVWANARGFDARVTSDPRLKYIPPSVQKRWNNEAKSSTHTAEFAKFHAQKLRIAGKLHRAGVPVMAGTDEAWYQAYTYAGFSLHDELSLLVRAGLTPMEALQSATINPARFLSMEKDLGSVEKGKLADLVLLSADPLQEITNTQKIETVIVRGRMLDRKALDSLLVGAENAVKNQ